MPETLRDPVLVVDSFYRNRPGITLDFFSFADEIWNSVIAENDKGHARLASFCRTNQQDVNRTIKRGTVLLDRRTRR